MTQLDTGVRAAAAEERPWLWDTNVAQTRGTSEHGRSSIIGANTGSASEAVPISLCGPMPQPVPWPMLSTHTSQSCSSTAILRWGCQCWERGEHTLKGNRASSDLTLSTSAPATWYLPLIEQWQPLKRGEAPAHTWLWPQPLHLHLHFLPRWQLPTHPEERQNLCSCQSSSPTKVTGHLQTL